MKIALLLTSHILHKKQIKILGMCIKRLLLQTYKCDILFSVSFENDKFKNLFYQNIKNKFDTIHYYEKDNEYKRISQFEHMNILKDYVQYYDYIHICEDDNLYKKNRIETLLNHIIIKNKKDNIEYFAVAEQNYKQPKSKHYLIGMCAYLMKPIVFISFFDIMYNKNTEQYLQSNYCSVLFCNYMQIILWKTQKMYYMNVYNNLYNFIPFHEKNKYTLAYLEFKNLHYFSKKIRITHFIEIDLFECPNIMLNDILKHYKIKKNKLHQYITMEKYAKLKNLIISFYFIKF